MAKISLTKKVKQEIESGQDHILKILLSIASILFIGFVSFSIKADEIVHKFKSPSFNGVNTSSHYLTIENQEFNRKESIKADIKALQEQLERDAENTTLARFIRNLESRIFAQLSRQLVDNLFGENPSTSGILELMGNTIEYSVSEDGLFITLKITTPDGVVTEITLPIGTFTF